MMRDRRSGFSLVELAVVLIIIAAVMGVSLTAGDLQIKMARVRGTQDALGNVQDALDLFREKHHRYPCPAVPTDASTAATYGVEANCATACTTGLVCSTANNAVIGMVPFKTLGLGEDGAYDKWDGRLTYAIDIGHVSHSDVNIGSLPVVDANDVEVTQAPLGSRAIFVVVSHGPNNAGAYGRNGAIKLPCGAAGARKDVENCDRAEDRFRDMPANQGDIAAKYFDDQIVWQTQHNLLDSGNQDRIAPSTLPPDSSRPLTLPLSPQMQAGSHCAINGNKQQYCWGMKGFQVFPPTYTSFTQPTLIGSSKVDAVSSTFYQAFCALKMSDAYCQGSNQYGNIGSGNTLPLYTPSLVVGGHKWQSVTAGYWNSCGVDLAQTGYCWGYGYYSGTNNATASLPTPTEITGYKWKAIFAGYTSCGIATDGLGYCWGQNQYGELGVGSEPATLHMIPTAIASSAGGVRVNDWKTIQPVVGFTCGLTQGGRIYCWGRNHLGQLGNGGTTNSFVPVEISGGYTDWTDLVAGQSYNSPTPDGSFACGIRKGRLYCWGRALYHAVAGTIYPPQEFDPPINSSTPQLASSFDDWKRIATDPFYGTNICGLRGDNTIWCAGDNSQGQLGDGTTTRRPTMGRVQNLPF